LPAREGMTRDRILLHVADAILRLALRARSIRRAGARAEAPMPREGDEFVVKLNRSAHRVVTHHERAWIIHQHFLRHAAEAHECPPGPGEPVLLLPGPDRTRIRPSRMPERPHEHECFALPPADLDQTLAEVDLQLSARGCLEPGRRQRLRL